MCGRFALGIPRKKLRESLAVEGLPDAPARYNIAPGQLVEAVYAVDAPGAPARRAGLFRWGLVPGWAADPARCALLVNARSETAAARPAFRAAMRYRRCLVPAQGFYEWTGPRSDRQPWFITFGDGRVMALAGLYERHESEAGVIDSLAVLTCPANALVSPLHDRMPVLVDPADHARWLDPRRHDPELLRDILESRDWPGLTAYKVSPRVNRAASEGEDLIAALPTLC